MPFCQFSRFIQQQKLHFPSPLYRADFPPLVVAVGYILLIDVPVTGFQLLQQTAFRVFPISEQSSVTHIVAEYGKDQGIFPILAEQPVTLLQIPYQQFFRFRLRHAVGQFLSLQPTMSVTVVRIIRTVMESFVFFNQLNSQFRFRLIVERCSRFIRILCGQADGEQDRQHRPYQQPFHYPLTDRHLLSS